MVTDSARPLQLPTRAGPGHSVPGVASVTGSLDIAASLAALAVAALVVLGFSYTFLSDQGSLSAHLTGLNILLLHGGGVLFGAGLVAAVAGRRTALAVSMFFCFVFFFVALREQVLGEFDVILADQEIVQRSLTLCLVFALIVLAVNALPLDRSPLAVRPDPQPRSPGTLLMVLLTCCALQVAFIGRLGMALLSSRGELSEVMLASFGRAASALVSNFVFSLFFFLPAAALLGCRPFGRGAVRVVLAMSILFGCFINNPLVNPRFYVGALAIGTVLLIADPRRTGWALLVTSLGTLAAPLLNVFRDLWAWQHVNPQLGLASLRSFDFDAFTSICYGLVYSREYGLMHGLNILGSLLFFVPSATWTGKPEYTGGLLYDTVVRHYRLESPDNLSAPVPIEGYLAFGWPGVVGLSLAFALAVRWLDGAPNVPGLRGRCLSVRSLCLAYSPALLIFLARGSLMPTFAYTAGMFSAIALTVYLLRGATERQRWTVRGAESPLTEAST